MITRKQTGSLKPKILPSLLASASSSDPLYVPTCYSDAIKYPYWRQAILDEYTSLVQNNIWELVPLTNAHNLIGSKWLYRVKLDPDSSISRYKERLVAQGFKQQYGLNFDQTFSRVIKPATIRTLLTIAVTRKWDLRQLDVKNAFLNETLSETVYMKQPQGFVHPDFPTHACLLQKSLYGLKEAPRAWFQNLFDKFIVALNERFQLNDLGRLNYFLGIEKYIKELLSKYGMVHCTSVKTPITPKGSFMESGSLLSNPHEYKCLVGSLQYLSATRPDITYAVNQASQSMHKPTTLDFSAGKRILRYLAGTSHHGLSITSSSSFQLRGYSDSDWAGCPITRRSTSGYCVFIGPNLIS
ncbi:transmembrane signal receptor [Lithospermum erythrorhizon]|uniref:Transmembrane signal receptor n=1 Tax=Lithospermum erythrorhizon TaxID=34254 RepID=A0AAV3PAH5_LITER